jgi:hypothetical protein
MNSISSKQKPKSEIIYNRYVCKFNGTRDHGKNTKIKIKYFFLDFIEIEDDRIVNIQKFDEVEKSLIKTNWSFTVDRVYDETIEYEELYENEVVCSDFFSNIYKSLKCTFILVGKNSDHFYNTSAESFRFLWKGLQDIFSFSSLPYKYMRNNYTVAISYIDISENKIKDNFNFDTISGSDYCKLKIIEYNDEIILDGIKEISIKTDEQALSLIR